jgi:hypothetical protein
MVGIIGPLKRKQLTMLNLSYIFNDMTERTEERRNRFSGESIMLTPEEAKKHDQIFIDELQATIDDKESGIEGHSKHWQKMRDNLEWFMKNNAEAYMVLLD